MSGTGYVHTHVSVDIVVFLGWWALPLCYKALDTFLEDHFGFTSWEYVNVDYK